jgi:hypothetical protein
MGQQHICSQSMQSGVKLIPVNATVCAALNNVKLGEKCPAVDGYVTSGDRKGLSHKVCYDSGTATGCKYDGGTGVCQTGSTGEPLFEPEPEAELQAPAPSGDCASMTDPSLQGTQVSLDSMWTRSAFLFLRFGALALLWKSLLF